MPQTSYSANAAAAVAGLCGDLRPAYKTHKINEESVAIPFGIFVARGASGDKVKEPDTATDLMLGVVENTHWAENQSLTGSDGIAAGGSMTIIENGTVWMQVEETVAAGDPVYVRFTSDGGSNTQLGKVRTSADSGRARRVSGAMFATGASTGGYAMVDLRHVGYENEEVELTMFDHAQNANNGDQTDNLFKTPADRYFVVTGVDYVNPTGLAAHATNYGVIALKHGAGPTIAASWSTKDDAEGTLTADTTVSLTNGTIAARTIPPGTQVFLSVSEQGTTTVPAGRIAIKGYWL